MHVKGNPPRGRAPIGPTWESQRDGSCELGRAGQTRGPQIVGEIPDLFFFKALTRELQCPAVLRDRANDVIRGSLRHLGFYLEGHRDPSSHQAGKMRDHLVRDPARVAAHPRGIKCQRSHETAFGCGNGGVPAGTSPGPNSSPGTGTLFTRPYVVGFSVVRSAVPSRHLAVDARCPV